MCVRPILVDNPYFGQQRRGLAALHDCEMSKLRVPCGHCPECIAMRQVDISQRIHLASLDSYCAMFTLTYRPDALPQASYCDGETGEESTYSYADFTDVQTMVRTLRQSPRGFFGKVPFKYFVVSERGGQRRRPHFHGILFFPRSYFPAGVSSFEAFCREHEFDMFTCWARNAGTRKHPVWVRNSDYVCRMERGKLRKTYDFHAIVPRSGDLSDPSRAVSYYVTKYLCKQFGEDSRFEYKIWKTSDDPEDRRAFHRRRCRYVMSKHLWSNFTLPMSHPDYSPAQADCVRRSVERSARDGEGRFKFLMADGTTTPMGISLRRRLTLNQYMMVLTDLPDGGARIPDRYLSADERMVREEKGRRRMDRASSVNALEDYDGLYGES